MAIFEYRGMDKAGKSIKGTVDADSMRNARMKLKKDGYYIVDLKNRQKEQTRVSGKKRGGQGGVNVEALSMMTRQLATLVKSQIPLVEALSAVADQVENETLKTVLTDIRDMVNEGSPFFKALGKYPKIFSKIYITMAEAGEQSGTLDVILIRLAEFAESQNELTAKIRSAMIYPVLMMVFMALMLSIIFVYVIPNVSSIFEQSDMQLPWFSKLIIDMSGFLVNYWLFIIISVVGLAFIFIKWKSTPAGADRWDEIVLKIPVVGKLVRLVAVSRFTRTLATLLAGGVPMLNAMDIVKNVVNNSVLAKAITEARDNISEGESVAGPLKKSGQFPALVTHMINIGEKTGEMENMLTQVSDSYDFQVKNEVSGLTSLLEPLMIVVMGAVIGIIVFAIMVPIFQMSNLAR